VSLQTAMNLMAWVEFALWTLFGFLFWARKLHLRFPAMGIYLALHVVTMPVLLFLFYGQAQHWLSNRCFYYYYFVYWAVYIASAILLFFVCIEVFRSALSAFLGLQKLGTVAFRWAALVSVILSLSTVSFEHSRALILADIGSRLMRSVSILELCLLAFLCLSMNALCLSARDMAFGISLGFTLISTNDFLTASLLSRNHSLIEPLQFASEAVILLTLGMWVAYSALPEPVRRPVVLPASSTLLRWNEIASALGHTGTQVAVQPAEGYALTGVERVVEGVLRRNLKKRESET